MYLQRESIMFGHTHIKSMDQPGKVANPACSQLNRENEYFPVRIRAGGFGLARRVQQLRPAPACRAYLLPNFSRVPRRRPFIHFKPPYAIGQSRVYRVTQLRIVDVHCRESAGTEPVNLKVGPNECCFGRSPWTNKYAPLFPTPTIGMNWAC